MKKLLRFLLVPVFVGTSAITVVACGTSLPVSNEDILSSAVGRMQNHTFNMSADLHMNNGLPEDGKHYTDLSGSVRSRITAYYSDLVKETINWDYPSVAVRITADADNSPFLRKYGPDVESRINLVAHLNYRNLSRDKAIVVKINNDTSSGKDKASAIATTLSTYLSTSPTFNFSSLFKDGLTSAEAENGYYGKITAPLRFALLKETTQEQPIPIIDVAGVDLKVESGTGTIYNLNSNAVNAVDKRVEGTFQNLNLSLSYQNKFFAPLASQTIKVAQDFSKANNQIAEMLNQGNQALKFDRTTLPDEAQMLSDYDTDSSLRDAISAKLFEQIAIIYPTAKMSGNDPWDKTRITIDNADSSSYNKEDDNHGNFIVNLKFDFRADNASGIETLVSNIKINLAKS